MTELAARLVFALGFEQWGLGLPSAGFTSMSYHLRSHTPSGFQTSRGVIPAVHYSQQALL